MKYDNLDAFLKQLSNAASIGQVSPVYLLQSKEAFDRERALKTTVQMIEQLYTGNVSQKRFDGDKAGMGELGDELGTLPMFTAAHLVIVQGVDQAKKAVQEGLLRYLQRPFDKIFLIMTSEGLRANSKLYKLVADAGVILDVRAQKTWEQEKNLPTWITAEAARMGKQMDTQAAVDLFRQVGTDKTLLTQELKKLECYVGERTHITLQDVRAIGLDVSPASVWDLGKAIFSFDATEAIEIARQLLRDGLSIQGLLRQLRSQIQTDAQVCSILSTGGTPDEVTHEFGYMRGRILQQHVQAAQRYGMARFRRALILCDGAELDAKNSGADPELLVELLLVRLTH